MKAWFVSDIHIFGPEDPRLVRLEKFLEERKVDGTTHLFLVGDIFDLWVGDNSYFAERYQGIVKHIRSLLEKSVEIHYFEGNHDLHLEKFWEQDLGVKVHRDAQYFDLGLHRVRVEHGDQMNPDDTGYLLLRGFLRSEGMTWLSHNLPGRAIQLIGNSMSRSSRKWTSSSLKGRDESAIRTMIRTHAEKAYSHEPYDILVSGHVHVVDEHRFAPSEELERRSGKTVQSINLGWWPPVGDAKVLLLEPSGVTWKPV